MDGAGNIECCGLGIACPGRTAHGAPHRVGPSRDRAAWYGFWRDSCTRDPARVAYADRPPGLVDRSIYCFLAEGCPDSRLIVLLVAFMGAIGAVSAPDQALYLARDVAWGPSTVHTYLDLFQAHPLHAAPVPFHFAASPDPRVEGLFGTLSGATDWNNFLAKNDTQAFIVIRDGQVVYENYFNNTTRDSMVTSFSMAKSFTSALIGKAIQDGFIKSVDDPITNYLPEHSPNGTPNLRRLRSVTS